MAAAALLRLPHSPRVLAMASAASPRSPRRFAVLKTGHALPYTERVHGGYGVMLRDLLRGPEEEQWDVFHVLDGDFTFMDYEYEGYVITGSSADAHADDEWIVQLCAALAQLHGRRKRLLGICFGHQVLARALGGKTGRADAGWELGLKRISVETEAVRKLYGLDMGTHLYAIESHRDQVSEVPTGAVVLASSAKTKIEMFSLGENVLVMQFHPEFTKDVIVDIVQTRLEKQIISDEVAEEALQSVELRGADQELLKQLCKAFLKGTPVDAYGV